MQIGEQVALVSGGASGLGRACAAALIERGARVVVLDLKGSDGSEVAAELGKNAVFVPGDVTSADDVAAAVDCATSLGELRVLVHTAGIGGPLRVIDRQSQPGSLDTFTRLIQVNVVGTFNVLRSAAAVMAGQSEVDGERGVCVLTSSVAAYEGRIGQVHYAASKAAVAGMVLPAARDLASKLIRVCAIAPGIFDTPLLGRLSGDVRVDLAAQIPHPRRLGRTDEFAALAMHIVDNPMLNGETIRLDGALRMTPR